MNEGGDEGMWPRAGKGALRASKSLVERVGDVKEGSWLMAHGSWMRAVPPHPDPSGAQGGAKAAEC